MRPTVFAFTEVPRVVTGRWGKYTASGGRGRNGSRTGGCIGTAGSPGPYLIAATLLKYATNVFIPPLAWPQS